MPCYWYVQWFQVDARIFFLTGVFGACVCVCVRTHARVRVCVSVCLHVCVPVCVCMLASMHTRFIQLCDTHILTTMHKLVYIAIEDLFTTLNSLLLEPGTTLPEPAPGVSFGGDVSYC